jgi:hypothetical protein
MSSGIPRKCCLLSALYVLVEKAHEVKEILVAKHGKEYIKFVFVRKDDFHVIKGEISTTLEPPQPGALAKFNGIYESVVSTRTIEGHPLLESPYYCHRPTSFFQNSSMC